MKIKLCIVGIAILGIVTSHTSSAQVFSSLQKEEDTTVVVSHQSPPLSLAYKATCLQCAWGVRLLDVTARLTDTTLEKYVRVELVAKEKLIGLLLNGNEKPVEYVVTITKPFTGTIELAVRFTVFIERPSEVPLTTIPVVSRKIHVRAFDAVLYANPSIKNLYIPPVQGMYTVGSFILKNNHPTKRLLFSGVRYNFVDSQSSAFVQGDADNIHTNYVMPGDSILFDVYLQLHNLTETKIQTYLYLYGWYEMEGNTPPFTGDTLVGLSQEAIVTKVLGTVEQGISAKDITPYPNPCTTRIVCQTDEPPRIVNMHGSYVLTPSTHTGNGYEVDTSLLPAGMYFIVTEHKKHAFIKM